MKKLLFIIPNFNSGGAEKVTINIINLLANKYKITLVVFESKGLYLNLLNYNVDIIDLKTKKLRYSLFKIISLVYKLKPKSIYDINPKSYQIEDIITNSSKINFIKCGSNNLINQKREQWTDGANAFALSPGVAIGYEHNTHTIEELKSHGYTILSSSKIDSCSKLNAKTFISFPGYELSRGRGGARCLTLPLNRE